jgi:hypothetical protein
MRDADTTLDPGTFRGLFAARILALLGAASFAGGCWDGEAVLTGFGGGGPATAPTGGGATTGSTTTGSTTTSSTTSTATSTCAATAGGAPCGNFRRTLCFTPAAMPCPTDPCVALSEINAADCDASGLQACQIDSAPTVTAGACCYATTAILCPSGGRPYLVEERAVVSAPLVGAEGRGWSEGERPSLDALTEGERAILAEAWTASGLLEHASVASFSRFSLSLLAAGAPAVLVLGAHRAALDEMVHAKLCFALASAYRGETIAPGPFPLAGGVHVAASLAAIAVSTLEEGCVGETVAAVVASEQLARAADPAVRAALTRIAADEARHAELAWSTVAWAVRAGGAGVRAAVAQAFAELLRRAPQRATTGRGARERAATAMEAHGHLDAATLADIVAAVMREVVEPAVQVLLFPGTSQRAEAFAP